MTRLDDRDPACPALRSRGRGPRRAGPGSESPGTESPFGNCRSAETVRLSLQSFTVVPETVNLSESRAYCPRT
eukprot:613065-Hanusia_phi.AAC.4